MLGHEQGLWGDTRPPRTLVVHATSAYRDAARRPPGHTDGVGPSGAERDSSYFRRDHVETSLCVNSSLFPRGYWQPARLKPIFGDLFKMPNGL